MSVAYYVRVSTQQQAHTQTIAQQLERLQAYSQAQGWPWDEEHVFRDDGYSGATLRRPGLEALREQVAHAAIERVVITAPDRLARSYVHQVLLSEEFTSQGCQIEFLERPMSTDPHDQLLLQIRAAVAEYERYAEFGIAFVMPSARLCRAERETWGKMGSLGRSNRHNRSPLDRHRPSRKASRLSEGL